MVESRNPGIFPAIQNFWEYLAYNSGIQDSWQEIEIFQEVSQTLEKKEETILVKAVNRKIEFRGNRVSVINLIWIPSAAQGWSWQKDNLKNTYESVMCKTYTIYKTYKNVYAWKCCSNDSSISKFGLFYFINEVVYNVLYFRMELPYSEASIQFDFLAGVK